jgi:hypothetical protein
MVLLVGLRTKYSRNNNSSVIFYRELKMPKAQSKPTGAEPPWPADQVESWPCQPAVAGELHGDSDSKCGAHEVIVAT